MTACIEGSQCNGLMLDSLRNFTGGLRSRSSMEFITSFLRRSACSLRSFSMIIISIVPPFSEGFMSLLRSMLSLNTISITSITATIDVERATSDDYDLRNFMQLVVKILTSQSTSLGFLPKLKVLEYTGKLWLRPGNYSDLYPLPPAADNAVHHGPFCLLKLNIRPAIRIPENMANGVHYLFSQKICLFIAFLLYDHQQHRPTIL